MFFHDRVGVLIRTEVGRDNYNRPIFETVERLIPAHVDSTTTTEGSQSNTDQIISRYRVLMRLPADVGADGISEVVWKGKTLRVDGAVQPQMIRGRISHHEFVTEKVTG